MTHTHRHTGTHISLALSFFSIDNTLAMPLFMSHCLHITLPITVGYFQATINHINRIMCVLYSSTTFSYILHNRLILIVVQILFVGSRVIIVGCKSSTNSFFEIWHDEKEIKSYHCFFGGKNFCLWALVFVRFRLLFSPSVGEIAFSTKYCESKFKSSKISPTLFASVSLRFFISLSLNSNIKILQSLLSSLSSRSNALPSNIE